MRMCNGWNRERNLECRARPVVTRLFYREPCGHIDVIGVYCLRCAPTYVDEAERATGCQDWQCDVHAPLIGVDLDNPESIARWFNAPDGGISERSPF